MGRDLDSFVLRSTESAVPLGGRGIGEFCVIGTAAAVDTAVFDVTGIRTCSTAIRPEPLLAKLPMR